ncbi:MAG: endonuclease/exonuclease/phosphatase family protein [Pyrinomonadaceae bacterium]
MHFKRRPARQATSDTMPRQPEVKFEVGRRRWRISNHARVPLILAAVTFCLLLSSLCLHAPPAAVAQSKSDHAEDAQSKPVSMSGLLEIGQASKIAAATHAPVELKLVSYNMRWSGGVELQKLIKLLHDDLVIGHASIIGLQEADRHKKRTDYANTARVMAESLGMHYAWAAPPSGEDEEEETGVAILSPYKLIDVERIVLPNEGPQKRRRVALGATVLVGDTPVRVYSVHGETRMAVERKVEHWRGVLEDLARYPKVERVVVLGDFNTTKGKDVKAARKLFTGAGFMTPFPDDRSTWRTFIIKLKLDWMWLRGLKPIAFGVDEKVGMSDHWPLWASVKFERGTDAPPPSSPSGSRP